MNTDSLIAIASIVAGIISASIGFLLKLLFGRIRKQDENIASISKDMTDLKVALPTNYVTKLEFVKSVEALFNKLDDMARQFGEKLDRMNDKLDNKADR